MSDEIITHKHRNDGIDALRGLSIISVILLHLYIRVPLDLIFIDQAVSISITNILFRSGYYGVIVFFVISGFLITTTSLKRWEICKVFLIVNFIKCVLQGLCLV